VSEYEPTLPAPDHLSEAHTTIWNELVSAIEDNGRELKRSDMPALESLVQATDQMRKMDKVLETVDPFVALGRNGAIQTHPAIGIRLKCWDHIRKLGPQFGLTPKDRTNLNKIEPAKTDDLVLD
jgi:P27 family predicted phage terminase small subunit